jgi:hypothetical protein
MLEHLKENMERKSLIIVLVVYVVTSLASYGAFSYFYGPVTGHVSVTSGGDEVEEDDTLLGSLLTIDPSEPADQACPLNGKLFTNTEKEAWEQKRPLFVMIENSPDARPQSGLSDADIVFETIAEGGVTRFGAMFYCGAQLFDTTIAPIRSARTYFVDWASGYNLPLYVHVGGANVPGPTNALGQISDYGWNGENDLNQFSIGYPTFVRDYNRIAGKEIATEHTMVTSSEKLWAVAAKRGWTNMSPDQTYRKKTIEGTDWKEDYTGWTFEEEASAVSEVTSVSYDFWTGYNDYSVTWDYDAASDTFLRSQGSEKHIDLNNDKRVAAANVIVIKTSEKGPINEKKHMIYGTTGTGKALLFKHGDVFEVTWSKKTRETELTFADSKGKEVELARGLTWISVVSKTNNVEY